MTPWTSSPAAFATPAASSGRCCPRPRSFSRVFSKHFIVWDPRDVVGGDIYWSAKWGEGQLFVLGDCTGHGVPGAFMTLISTGALSRALNEGRAGPAGPAHAPGAPDRANEPESA